MSVREIKNELKAFRTGDEPETPETETPETETPETETQEVHELTREEVIENIKVLIKQYNITEQELF